MTKRILLVLLASLTIGVQAFAQTVSGKVADANGEAIPGAGVLVKGTTTGTVTDLDGKYQLNAGSNAVLVFSCVGYQNQEVAVGNQSVINVVLTEDSTLLEETVVIAYGTAKKKDLTGSLSTVDGSSIAVQAQGSVTRALEGQVAGLQVSAIDGQPGWDTGIRVRGMGTANVNYSNALVIIDGVPANDPGNSSAVTGTNPLSAINPKDIESITVLKDAASTALYGSRGANGVVLVTTKSGKTGKTRISFEARMGINTVGANGYFQKVGDKGTYEIYEQMWMAIRNAAYFGKAEGGAAMAGNAEAAAKFASEHLFNYTGSASSFGRNALGNRLNYSVPGMTFTKTGEGTTQSSTLGGTYLVGTDGKLAPGAQLLYTPESVQDVLITNKFRQEYNIAANGGTEKIDYHMSLGYLSDPSYVSTSKFERITARANVNAQVTNWLKAGIKMAYVRRTTNSVEFRWAARNTGTCGENPFYWTTFTTSLDNIYAYDAKGNLKMDANGNKLFSATDGTTGIAYSAYTDSPVGPTTGVAGYNLPLLFDQFLNSQVLNDFDMKGYLRASFLKHFTAEVNGSYTVTNAMQERFFNVESAGPRFGTSYGSGMQKYSRSWATLNTQQLINYNQNFGKNHVDAMIGHEYTQFDSDGISYSSTHSLINDFHGYVNFLGTDTQKYTGGSNGGTNLEKTAMESYFARANYIYDDKYYVSASIRRDGSSKFKTEQNRWGTFWSVGGGWRISSEPWMEGAKNWLSNLKLRASYGVIGNQNGVGNYSGYQTWAYGAAKWSASGSAVKPDGTTLKMNAAINDALTWEKVNTADAGLDFTLFGGKLAGSFDWFNKQTNNSIFNNNVSYLAAGQGTLNLNTAGIRSTGIEIDLSYQPVKTKDWDVIISTNGTHYTTTLTSVPEGYGSEALGGCSLEAPTGWTVAGTGADADLCYLRGVGKDYYNMYMQKYAGVAGNTGITYYGTDGNSYTGYTKGDPYAGEPLFWHSVTKEEAAAGLFGGAKEGDDIRTTNTNLASRYELGSAVPAWIGGFNFKVRYKGFDLAAMFSYQIGGKFLSIDYATGEDGKYTGSAAVTDGAPVSRELMGNTWSETNLDAKFPMIYYGGASYQGGGNATGRLYTDLALFDASYLSLKNVTLGYTFPSKWMNKAKISNLRIYLSADNSLMAFAHSGVDPRRSLVGGTDLGAAAYPALAVYSFGVNLDF